MFMGNGRSESAFACLLIAIMMPFGIECGDAQSTLRTIMLRVPSDIGSETVQINYFMIGPFGGYGGYVTAEKGRVSYDIPATLNGKPAESVKIIAYLPGCEIAKLEITMQSESEARTIPCKPLGSLPLHGRMLHFPASESSGIEIQANYLAPWDHQFFGIADGLVTSIRIGTAIPDEEGRFNFELPDLYRQAGLGTGSFQFLLRDSKSKNIIGILTPVNIDQYFDGLAIRSTYEPFVTFSLDTSVSTSWTKASRAIDQ
jgi:hypothetical protein